MVARKDQVIKISGLLNSEGKKYFSMDFLVDRFLGMNNQDISDNKKAKEEAQAKHLTAVESTIAKLKATYNDATIVEGTSGSYCNTYSRKNWINYPIVTVTLANGVKVVYRIYSDGSLGRLELTFPNQKDAYSLLSALNTI